VSGTPRRFLEGLSLLAVQPPIVAWLEAVVAIGPAAAIVPDADRVVSATPAHFSDDIVGAPDAGLGAGLVTVAGPGSRLMVVDSARQEGKVVQPPPATHVLLRMGRLAAAGPFGRVVGPATATPSAAAIVRAALASVAAASSASTVVGAAAMGAVIAATTTATAAVIAATTAAATVIATTAAMIASAMIASTTSAVAVATAAPAVASASATIASASAAIAVAAATPAIATLRGGG
jgi:hypothetical protein